MLINLSSDIVSSIVNATSTAVQQLWPIIIIVFSVVLAFFGIRKILFTLTLAKR